MNNTLTPDLLSASSTPPAPLSTTNFDLLWRNRTPGSSGFGENYLWTMQDTVQTNSTRLMPVADASWQIVGTADANQDSVGDILWRNNVSGVNVWWYMDTQGQIIQSAILQQVADTAWNIVGVADQDGDGQIDLLWRNFATGDNLWWLMQGTTIKAGKSITSLAPANNDWEIKGLGDVNQDGQIDLFWSNRATRQMVWWVMDGTNSSSNSFLIEADASGAIGIETADFNNDKAPDIILRNRQTGANTLLIMDNATVLDRYTIAPVDSNWDIVGLVPRVEAPRTTSIASALTEDPTKPSPIVPNTSARFFKRDQVSAQSPDRLYAFNVSESGLFTANLTGLTADSDVRLIQDNNGNGLIDAGESVLASLWERGTTRESLRRFITTGSYLIQVSRYPQQNAPQSLQYSLSSNFTAMASDPNKFNLVINFGTGTERLNQAAKDAIVSASKFWESVITERSAITQFKDLTINILGGTDVFSTLATGAPLVSTRNDSLFLVGGEVNLNTMRYDTFNADPNYLRSVMLHELAHTLGFGTIWEPIAFPTLGKSIGRSLLNRTSQTYNGNTYAGYAYGDLLGQFGNGVAVPIDEVFAHWSESVFDPELMTPFAEVSGVAMPLSALTLSSLRDLGWRVNYGAAQAYGLTRSV